MNCGGDVIGGLSTAPGGNRVSPAQWDDLRFPATGQRIDSASTRYSFDYTNVGIIFDADARYPNEVLTIIAQNSHSWKLESDLHPHIHYIQDEDEDPNFLLAYRVYDFGEVPPAFAFVTGSAAMPFVAGGEQLHNFPVIDMTGRRRVSTMVDIKLWRDTTNASTEFAGVDPYTAALLYKEFDLHYEKDSAGSDLIGSKGF